MTSKINNDTYVKPKQTYTDQLDDEDINEKLADYLKVEDINTVKINTHLRYFSLIPDNKGQVTRKFRMGGFLTNKDNADKYVILSNGRKTWPVQTASSVFYRKMSIDEIKEEYENDLLKLNKINKKLFRQNEKLKMFITNLGHDYHDI